MHGLVWYTRAEIVRIKDRNYTATHCAKSDSRFEDTKQSMCVEISEILVGMVKTLDDTLTMGVSSWTALFLAHVILTLTVHLELLKTCHDAYQKLGLSVLGLDNNYVRVNSHISTVVCMCKVHLGYLCCNAPPSASVRSCMLGSPVTIPAFRRSRTNSEPLCTLKREDSCRTLIRKQCDVSQITSKSYVQRNTVKPTHPFVRFDVQNKDLRPNTDVLYKDVVVEHVRLGRKLSCKNLVFVHNHARDAMCDVVSGEGKIRTSL